MTEVVSTAPRKARVDGQRNRAMILKAAKHVLTEKGAGASLDEIAQAAGVGNGTLYRHFATSAALLVLLGDLGSSVERPVFSSR